DAEKFCQWLLEEFEFEGSTVMFAPGNGFYTGKKLGENQVRIAYVLEHDKLKKAIKCLREALKVYPGRTIEQ
ncbi:MAG TPA: pyridoxal phosphate-dependent aminotransferase, partial [Bacteroidales bacterium]|nr:pyridoxal phosphate-dependent aminotransferase [Bacteroidales bacterium]